LKNWYLILLKYRRRYPIKRQVRGSDKKGIPDILGIDQNGSICIIEMKNVVVDSNVIPQVLEYAL
jgi:RecB family endonuclease NucS